MNGKIKSLVTPPNKTGPTYGFIESEDGLDRFFLPEAVGGGLSWDSLKAGEPVEFDHQLHTKGIRAINIRAANGHSS